MAWSGPIFNAEVNDLSVKVTLTSDSEVEQVLASPVAFELAKEMARFEQEAESRSRHGGEIWPEK